jgi:hypothetical protein
MRLVFTPKALHSKAQGRDEVAHPGLACPAKCLYAESVTQTAWCNPFGVDDVFELLTQGGAAAPLTLGFGMKPLRGKSIEAFLIKNL